MKIGVALPHYDFSFWDGRPAGMDSLIAFAREIEAAGFDSGWVSDHFFFDLAKYGGPATRYGTVEPLTALAALAVETERIRLGTLVLSEAFRPPALLAKMAATIDVVSGGRLDLGLGAGWYEAEYRAAGFDFPSAGTRIARLREAAIIVGGMLAQSPFSFSGKHYSVDGATNDPQPVQQPRPPIWIGGKGGPKMAQVVVEAADGWNTVWRWEPKAYAERVEALHAASEKAGRDPKTVRLSLGLYTLVGTDRADLEARYRRYQEWAPGGSLDSVSLDEFAEGGLVGTPEQCIERIKEFEALGVEHLICAFGSLPFAVGDPEQPSLVASEILPAFRNG